jgi:hypothetical protein
MGLYMSRFASVGLHGLTTLGSAWLRGCSIRCMSFLQGGVLLVLRRVADEEEEEEEPARKELPFGSMLMRPRPEEGMATMAERQVSRELCKPRGQAEPGSEEREALA